MNTVDIPTLYTEATYWHGTGRYKYSEQRSIVDVLRGMIAEGGLVPHDDDWDWKLGKIQSISLARSRMYARLYALMYVPGGERLQGEYGPRWLWFHYFFGTARLAAFIKYRSPYGLLRDYKNKLQKWVQKVSGGYRKKLFHVFKNGTDITQNYPILIGIKGNNVNPAWSSWVFWLHEVRSVSKIAFNDMTHIEVPQINVAETVALLRDEGIQIPVIPIEEGETYCRRFSFFKLVNGRPLKNQGVTV